jgi:hypothetical protein
MPAHWIQRDAFDTGKRNHMQQHDEVANKRFKIKEEQRNRALNANSLVADKGFAYFSAIDASSVAKAPAEASDAQPQQPVAHLPLLEGATSTLRNSTHEDAGGGASITNQILPCLPADFGGIGLFSSDTLSRPHGLGFPPSVPPTDRGPPPRRVRILEQCKHVDRKHDHAKCEGRELPGAGSTCDSVKSCTLYRALRF